MNHHFIRTALISLSLIFGYVVAIKPIGTIQVTLEGKTYKIHNVATVSEVRDQLQQELSIRKRQQQQQQQQHQQQNQNDNTTTTTILQQQQLLLLEEESPILFQGKPLKPTDILRRVGVKEGTKLVIELPTTTTTASTTRSRRRKRTNNKNDNDQGKENKSKKKRNDENNSSSSNTNPFGNSGSNNNNKNEGFFKSFSDHFKNHYNDKIKDEQPQPTSSQTMFDWMNDVNMDYNDLLDSLRNIQRDDVSHAIRESLTSGYHKLRTLWTTPEVRTVLTDPTHMEMFRQAILSNPEFQTAIEQVPGGKELLHNPKAWRIYFQTLSELTLHAGDTILDGLLDVLIDILKSSSSNGGSDGRGRTYNDQQRSSSSSTSFQLSDTIDPSVASDVLFELSESEEEEY